MVALNAFSLGLLAQNYIDRNDYRNLVALTGDLLARNKGDATVHALHAFGLQRLGQPDRADAALARAMETGAGEPFVRYYAAALFGERGDLDRALRHYAEVLADLPWFYPARERRRDLVFPGLPYLDVLALAHRVLRPSVYLEIGVDRGKSLALALDSQLAIGIDPNLSLCPPDVARRAQLFGTTSDAFFASDADRALNGHQVELGFIDGLHIFDNCLRDFANLERLSGKASTILIHDVIPLSEIEARRIRASGDWVGDVWKILPCLVETRPDLDLSLVMSGPSGLLAIRKLDPAGTHGSAPASKMRDGLDEIIAIYRAREFPGGRFWEGLGLRRVAAEPDAVTQFLAA